MKQSYLTLLLLLFAVAGWGQTEKAIVTGIISDAVSDAPIDLALIYIKDTNISVETASNGRYRIEIPANEEVTLVFSRIGFKETETVLPPMPVRSTRQIDVSLAPIDSDLEVIVRESKIEEAGPYPRRSYRAKTNPNYDW